MRAVCLGLLALFGCDTVFGLDGRGELDASIGSDTRVDGPDDGALVDARVGCPTTGGLQFAANAVPVLSGCIDYTTSEATGQAMMTCSDVFTEAPLATGSGVAATIAVESGQTIRAPRLAPSGTEMFVISDSGTQQSIRVYQRTSAAWTQVATPAGLPTAPSSMTLSVSSPTSAKRLMVHSTVFREYGDEGSGMWTLVHEYSEEDLGVQSYVHPQLSADGLHLVFSGRPSIMGENELRYAFRPSTSVKFDTSVKIALGAEVVLYPHLAADCSRLYFWANNVIYYVERQ